MLRQGRIAVNGSPTTRHDHPLQPGDVIGLDREKPQPGSRALAQAGVAIVHEDADLIVLEKPIGLLTVSTDNEKTDTAFARLHNHLIARRGGRPFVVHRLDRETSGLLLVARSPAVRDRLQANWQSVTKTYFAVVAGTPRPTAGIIDNYIVETGDLRVKACEPGGGAQRAISEYRTITYGRCSLVEVDLKTGRKHQIRVHLADMGCPVIGDDKYGSKHNPARRLGLHSWKLAFPHPVTKKLVEVESALPAVLAAIV